MINNVRERTPMPQQDIARRHYRGQDQLADAQQSRQHGGHRPDSRAGGQPRPGGKNQQNAVDQSAGDELADAEGAEDDGDVRDKPTQVLDRRRQSRAHGGGGDPGCGLSVSSHKNNLPFSS